MNYLENIETIHPDVIDEFVRTGCSIVIPIDLQHIINQMVYAVQIYRVERNISLAARKLQTRALAEQGVNLNISTAKSRIYAALNYFDVDCNVAENVWLRDYANKYEDLVKVALAQGRTDIAERCMSKALDCRMKATVADKQASLGIVYVMSDDMRAEDIGFTTTSKKDIARKATDGAYSKMIESLNISKDEKKRLRADAGIDVEFEEIEENE